MISDELFLVNYKYINDLNFSSTLTLRNVWIQYDTLFIVTFRYGNFHKTRQFYTTLRYVHVHMTRNALCSLEHRSIWLITFIANGFNMNFYTGPFELAGEWTFFAVIPCLHFSSAHKCEYNGLHNLYTGCDEEHDAPFVQQRLNAKREWEIYIKN